MQTIVKALLLAGLLSFWGTVALAAPDEALIARLISAGRLDEARAALEAGNPTEADRRFFEARLVKGAGDFDAAADMFRAVLQADPRYINARRELAHTLLLAGEYDAAEFHFRELIRIDPVPRLVEQYRGFLQVIAQNQPLSIGVYGALLPSTNVNRGTTNAVFDTDIGQFIVDPDSQAESGVGIEAGFNATLRFPVDARGRFLVDLSAAGRFYDNSEFDSITGVVAPAYEFAFAEGRWRAGPYVRYAWRGDDRDYLALGGSGTLVHRITRTISTEAFVQAEQRTFRHQQASDGEFASITALVRKQIDPSFSVFAGGSLDRERTELDFQSYRGFRLSTGAFKRWQGGFDTRLRAEYGQRHYDADFPFTREPRLDTFWNFTGSILTSQLSFYGFTPQLSCSYILTGSNVGLFEYDSSECRIGLSHEF